MKNRWRLAGSAGALLLGLLPSATSAYSGTVVDAGDGKPVSGAYVTLGDRVVRTDANGDFVIDGEGPSLRVRGLGYGRLDLPGPAAGAAPFAVALPKLSVKALYLSFFGIGDRRLRERVLDLVDDTEVNAVVIDVKGDNGKVPYRSSVSLVSEVRGQRPRTIQDLPSLLGSLHAKHIYVIARIVVFKDRLLAAGRPDLAVKMASGALWYDREESAWVDPFRKEVWDYNIEIAEEAARNGFDEIQFDYVRFPDAVDLRYSRPATQSGRVEAIDGFLVEARRRLVRYNVFLSADVFGYVCWNRNDTTIGQRIEDLAPLVDYVSPMLYPSSFQFGIPGYSMPVAHPYEIVHSSLSEAQRRTGLPASHFRPWLQAFRDYAFDRRAFDGAAIRAQIRGAEDFGSSGWMLWNPRNVYQGDGLAEE